MPGLQDLAKKEGAFSGGHRLCAGCPAPIFTRMLSRVTDYEIVVGSATGCLEVASSIFPFSAWKVPWIHTAFENAAATMSGVEAAYRVLKKKNRTSRCFGRSTAADLFGMSSDDDDDLPLRCQFPS